VESIAAYDLDRPRASPDVYSALARLEVDTAMPIATCGGVHPTPPASSSTDEGLARRVALWRDAFLDSSAGGNFILRESRSAGGFWSVINAATILLFPVSGTRLRL
jgi:hypothetical protein